MLLKKPIASIILVLAVLIFGGVTLSRLSIELLPDVTQPTLLVSTEYPGAPAADVEYRINEPLEGVLASVRGVQSTRGIARQGQSLIFLTFNWGADLDLAFLNVREKLDLARSALPTQSERPQLIYSSASDEPIATIALTLKNTPNQDFSNRLLLKRWAEQVFSRRLEQQDGIAQALLVGEVVPEVQIRYNPKILDRYGLTLSQVQQVIRDANVFSSSGELRDGWYRYALKIQSRIESLEDIKNVPVISLANGRVLLLHEIADIIIDEADPTSFALLDNQEVLNVLVKKEYGANTVTVFKTLEETLEQVRTENPDINIRVIREDATYIENSISNLLQTLIIGGILAFFVLFLFLDDIRSPFTIGVSIPVSIFLTFVIMYLFNIQLNTISLSGLTLGIGLLLDNSIVVLENINRYKKLGLDKFEAAKKGTSEIALAVTASTFTTISVFLPLVFLGGFEGAFFRDLAATLSISLVSSLLVALVILPVFVVQFSGKGSTGFLAKISRTLDVIIQKYEQSLTKVIKKPRSAFIAVVLLVALAGWMFMTMEKSALPESEPAHVEYLVTMPGNTALRSTKDASKVITDFLIREIPDASILSIGGYTDNTSLNSIQNEGLNKFTLSIPVQSKTELDKVEGIFDGLKKAYQTWSFDRQDDTDFGGDVGVTEAPVQFSMVGTDRVLNKRVADALQDYLAGYFPGIELTEKYPQTVDVFQLSLDPDKLLLYEISENEVILYLESLTRGSFVTDWNRQDEQISIRLMGAGQVFNNPSEIKLNIRNKVISLLDIATVEMVKEAEQLERSSQSAVLTFNSSLGFMDWWWDADRIREKVGEFMQQTGYEVRIGGSALALINLLKELGILLSISVLLIYLILAIQYENLKYPFIIILAIPFAWFGSIFALYIGGVSLNALSFMGILILTGIAVNDAILKVDFMRRYYDETGNLDEAVRQAGINRFRPVVMTSLTTILGLVPMLIPFGDGYVLRQSLAIALMGGMITSTVLTLYLVPLVFKWMEERKIKSTTAKHNSMKMNSLKSIFLFGAVLLLMNCTGEKSEIEKPDLESIRILPEVIFDVVDDEPLRFFIESRGVVEPIQQIPIIPRVSGFVIDHEIIAGREVEEGELLLQLDADEWENSKAEAYNKYLKAKSIYDVEIRLRKEDELKDNINEGYRITTGLADAELAYDRAKLNLSYTKIYAPFSGVISTKEVVSSGAYISAGKELGALVNTGNMRVRFDVLESEITALSSGMKVELTDPSGRKIEGEIVAISPIIDQKTKTGQAIVEVSNEEGYLKSGMTIEGRVFVRSVSGIVRMPRTALLERDGRTLVFKLRGNEVEWIYVTPVAMNNEWVIINHEEINPGDTLAVDQHFSISHQQQIIPFMAN